MVADSKCHRRVRRPQGFDRAQFVRFAEASALAYTYFIRAMTVVLERFSAGYVDIQGDGIFGLFGGQRSMFHAAACAITMRNQVGKSRGREIQ